MEKLQITGAVRRTVRLAGNIVLYAAFPTVTGETYAAKYAVQLLDALWDFTETTLGERAKAALLAAAKSGKLFGFHPHTLAVALEKKETKRDVLLTLTLTCNTTEKTATICRRFRFTSDETLRKGRATPKKPHEKPRKNG